MGFVGAELFGGDDVVEGEGGVGSEVGEEGGVAVGEGGEGEAYGFEGCEAAGGVGPGVEAVPEEADFVDFVSGPEVGEAVFYEEDAEGGVVVFVDGFEGGGWGVVWGGGGEGGGLGAGEVVVGLAPFLGEVWPGDVGAGEAGGHADGCGGGVEGLEGFGVKVIGYCGAPVDYRAEDLVSCQIWEEARMRKWRRMERETCIEE